MKFKLDSKVISALKTTGKIMPGSSLIIKIEKNSSILSFSTRGTFYTGFAKIDIKTVSASDITTMIDGTKFYQSLDYFRDSLTFTLDSGFVELSKNKKNVKIAGQTPVPEDEYDNIEIADFSLPTIESMLRHIDMISNNPVVLIKDQKLMVVSSGTREAILLADINEKILDKVTVNKNDIFVTIGLLGKYFVQVLKGIIAQGTWTNASSIKIYAAVKNDGVPGIILSSSDGTNKVDVFCRLLDDAMIKKEVGILATCSKFSPANKCIVNSLDLYDATNLSIIAASEDLSDNELILSNKTNPNILEIKNRSGSFSDEIAIPATSCKFNLSIRNVNLSNMLKGMGPISVTLRLDSSHPILMIESGQEKCFIACFNSAIKPFEVETIKDDEKAPVVVSDSKSSKEGAVQLSS